MKTNPLLIKIILLVTCFMLVSTYSQLRAEGVSAATCTSMRVAVNFRHNAEKNELTISVKGGTEAIMQLFIFTSDGILVKEVAVSGHTVTTVKGLKRGLYLYECFDKDERMNSGSLKIK